MDFLLSRATNTKNISRVLYFNTKVIRRVNRTTDNSIHLRHFRTCVNGVNILVNNVLTNNFALWSDKETDKGFHLTYDSTFVYNDIVLSGFETHSPLNQANALIIKNIRLTSINEIQALVYYNRTGSGNTQKAIGIIIELYNSITDPDLNKVLATTNEITTASETYRFYFPSVSTYTGFVGVDCITNIVNNTIALTEEANVISFPTEITGNI